MFNLWLISFFPSNLYFSAGNWSLWGDQQSKFPLCEVNFSVLPVTEGKDKTCHSFQHIMNFMLFVLFMSGEQNFYLLRWRRSD